KFRHGVSEYLRAHAFGGGSTEDLLHSYSAAAGRDVAPAFTTFIEQPGVPLVDATLRCEGDKASLALRQSRYLPLGSTAEHGRRAMPMPASPRSRRARSWRRCTGWSRMRSGRRSPPIS